MKETYSNFCVGASVFFTISVVSKDYTVAINDNVASIKDNVVLIY